MIFPCASTRDVQNTRARAMKPTTMMSTVCSRGVGGLVVDDDGRFDDGALSTTPHNDIVF